MSKPTCSTSDALRVTTSVIDRRVSKAKKELTLDCDNCCERCGGGGRLTWSHIVSVKWAKESGHAEYCWDKDNMELLCPDHHDEVESWTAEKRLEFYHNRIS